MKNKVVFPELVSELASVTNTSEVLCETFLKELFSLVTAELSKGKPVKIKKIGEFSVLPDGNVHFEPDKEISESLNAAFACFEPIELDDNVTDEDLDKCVALPGDSTESVETEDVDSVEDSGKEPTEESELTSTKSTEEENADTNNMESPAESNDESGEAAVETSIDLSAELTDDQDDAPSCKNEPDKRYFWRGFAWGALTAIVVVCIVSVVFHWDIVMEGSGRNTELMPAAENTDSIDNTLAKTDTAVVAPVVQKEEISMGEVKDSVPKSGAVKEWPKTFKVTSTAYLSNVSRKFYGHYAFWIYIYLENKNVIADPDNLPVGVVLSIPDPKKYDIDKNDPNSIKKAQLRAMEMKK